MLSTGSRRGTSDKDVQIIDKYGQYSRGSVSLVVQAAIPISLQKISFILCDALTGCSLVVFDAKTKHGNAYIDVRRAIVYYQAYESFS